MVKPMIRVEQRDQQPRGKTPTKLLLLASLLVLLWPTLGWAQESQIFRLVTFARAGDSRLGATHGEGQADIVDVHNAIRYLMREQPGTVGDLPYIPADMKTLIEAGSTSITAVRRVYESITRLKANARFSEPGGDERIFHPPTSVRLLSPIPNPSKAFGLAGNYHVRLQLVHQFE